VIFGYVVGTYVSICWRKFGVFWLLDHREQGCKLGAMWLDEIGRQRKRLFGLYRMRTMMRMLGSWCGVVGDV
jgi:hypothetical protein